MSNSCPIGYYNVSTSTNSECGPSNHFIHYANYKGGSSIPGYVNFNTKFDTTIATGTNSYEWGTCTSIYNYSDGPDSENTAGYNQAWKYGKGKTWASVIEMTEKNPIQDNLSTVSLELDLFGYGGDKTQSDKIALDIVLGRTDLIDGSFQNNPQPIEPYAGIAVRPYNMINGNFQGGTCFLADTGTTDNSWDTGIKLNGTFNNSGIDLTGLTGTDTGIKLSGDGQKIVFSNGKYGDVSLYVDKDSGLLSVEGSTGYDGYIDLLPYGKTKALNEKILNISKTTNKKNNNINIICIVLTILNFILLLIILFKNRKK